MSTETNPLQVSQGGSIAVVYLGEMIPNQLLITNLSTSESADFIIQGADSQGSPVGWSYFSPLGAGETASVLVKWPTSTAVIFNNSVNDVTIAVGGNGIFPMGDQT